MVGEASPGRCSLYRDWCANCGEEVDLREWHPVAAPPDAEGDGVYAFCRPRCRTEWLARRADPAE